MGRHWLSTCYAIGLVAALTGVVASPASADDPRQDKRLCGLAEKGFTYFPAADGSSGVVSFGAVVKNTTSKTAVKVDLIANFYNAAGRLVKTAKDVIGFDYITPKDLIRGGDTIDVDQPVASMKVYVVCAPQSASGANMQQPKLLKRLSFTGSVTALDASSSYGTALEGTFKNTGKAAAYNGTPTYILRDPSGRIVGGDSLSTGEFGSTPPGVEIMWDTTMQGSFPVATAVQGTVGYWGIIYN